MIIVTSSYGDGACSRKLYTTVFNYSVGIRNCPLNTSSLYLVIRGQSRVNVSSNFKLLWWSWNLGKVIVSNLQGRYETDIKKDAIQGHMRSQVRPNFKWLWLSWNLRKENLRPHNGYETGIAWHDVNKWWVLWGVTSFLVHGIQWSIYDFVKHLRNFERNANLPILRRE